MYRNKFGEAKKKLLIGGQYTHRSLLNFLELFYAVSVFDGMKTIQNGTVFDYAVIDNLLLEETNGEVIDGLLNKNPEIKIIIRDIPYEQNVINNYDTQKLELLANENKNILFPDNSYKSGPVIDLLDAYEKV